MATSAGPNISSDGLVFGYDTGYISLSSFDNRVEKRRHFLGKPTNNIFTDGHFPNGDDMESENDSNPTNEIVLLENPGESPYVLKQTMGSPYTEYQINKSNLVAGTTYVMSGWYAESPDYVGDSRMFHARTYSSSGNHIATGHGFYNKIKTKIVGGLEWKFGYQTINTPSDASGTLNWYVGYGGSSYSGTRYYTNIKMELGTVPTPYHAGTRSSTQSLIDLKKTTNIDVSNVSFDSNGQITFDGTDDEINIPSADWNKLSLVTVEVIVLIYGAPIDNNAYHVVVQKNGGYSGAAVYGIRISNSNVPFASFSKDGTTTGQNQSTVSGNAMTANKYYHLVYTRKVGESVFYQNGVEVSKKTDNNESIYNNTNSITVGQGDGRQLYGKVPVVKIHNKVLSADEVKQNYNVYKNRFGL